MFTSTFNLAVERSSTIIINKHKLTHEEFMQPNFNSSKHRRNSGEQIVVQIYSVTVE